MSVSNTELEPVDDRGPSYTYEPQQMSKSEAAVLLTLVVGAVAGFVAFIRYDLKEQKKAETKRDEEAAARKAQVDQFNEWVDAQPANGKVIVKPQVGTYIAVPVEAYSEIEIKRMPGVIY